jgi:acyl carrier protein/GNAT superfamily N-acetyltransferase
VTRDEIRIALLALLRERVLGGSDREIDPGSPLGEQGLGLDSLALLEFVTATEQKFDIEFPDSIWTDRGALSPESFIDLILEYQERSPGSAHRPGSGTEKVGSATDSRFEKVRAAISGRGLASGMKWIAGRIVARLASEIYTREGHVILAREIENGEFQETSRPTDLIFKQIFIDDEHVLRALWAPHHHPRMIQHLRRRLDSGFLCISAWLGEEVVGIDYLSMMGDFDTDTGLQIVTLPGTCYALDLYEKYRGRGIGVALLEKSLQETARRGLKRQVTFVRKKNSPMLATSVQIYGFRKIGEISTTKWFGKASSTWTLGPASGKNGKIQF